MLAAVQAAAREDLSFALPDNYMRGAGDTYFSGKMLARLGRVLLIAEETEAASVQTALFQSALGRLRSGVEIWLNGKSTYY
jgi:hypothetical protein